MELAGRAPVDEHARPRVALPLILGPHCEHCDARPHCPAFAAEALSLARAAYPYTPEIAGGMALTEPERTCLAGIIPAMESSLKAIKAAVQAGGPVTLADGRVWAPALEKVTSYQTRETFDALEPVVGEALANDAAEYSGASIKAALAEAAENGLPSMSWSRMRSELEARGAVVVAAREVWRKRWPAKPVEAENAVREVRQPESRDVGLLGEVGEGMAGEARDQGDGAGAERIERVGRAGSDVRGIPQADGHPDRAGTPEAGPDGPVAYVVRMKRANPLPATWMPSDALTRTLAGRMPPIIAEAVMPAYRAAMAGQLAGRWTDARFARWLDERAPAVATTPEASPVQLAIEGA